MAITRDPARRSPATEIASRPPAKDVPPRVRVEGVSPSPPAKDGADGFRTALRARAVRHAKAQREGPPPFGRYLAHVGVLGWTIVVPGLLGMFLGRWLDHRLGSGIFWTAPLMLLGLAAGCWGAWRWMHRP